MKIKSNFCYCALLLCMISFSSCNQENKQAPQQSTKYDLLTIKKGSKTMETNYTASIKGRQDIAIYSQVSGYLTDIKVNEGSVVKKGDILFVVDQVPYKSALIGAQANVAIAESNVANAELTYTNKKTLYEKNIISEMDLVSSENMLKSAKAQLQLAKSQEEIASINLSYTEIKSPSNGVVGKLPYRKGTLVSPSLPQSLTIVSDNSEMYVYYSMTENQLLDLISEYGTLDKAIANMPKVSLMLNNGTMYDKEGSVESISGIIENNTGAVSVRAAFQNPNKQLLSGGSGNVVIPYAHKDVITIPIEATYDMQDKICVFKVVDGKAKSTIIKISKLSDDKDYIVESGLNVGDVIIAEGAGLVREGAVVSQ